MIVGTGVDLCEVGRMQEAIERHGARILNRVFTEREVAYSERKANRFERYAARFAAKEAGMKALGTGWRGGLGWRDLEVTNLPSGRPTLTLHRVAAEIARKMGVRNISLSLTHTADQAMALVIMES
ncbi:MAG: holo-ACP synthase [Bryobacteraceae bacterium]|jgi:holo-[acyl-carrier protein] synthase